jgi:hypothetical protein
MGRGEEMESARGRVIVALVFQIALNGCDETTEVVDRSLCQLEVLPFSGSAEAPVLTDVGLEVQVDGIVPVATATDPQGFPNVDGVLQTLGVYPDTRCEGLPVEVQDDLAGVGIEETFGTAVPATEADFYGAIAAAATWPVRVRFSDVDGNVTEGDVSARLIR